MQRKEYGCSRLHQWPTPGPALMKTSLGRWGISFLSIGLRLPSLPLRCCSVSISRSPSSPHRLAAWHRCRLCLGAPKHIQPGAMKLFH